MVSALILAVPLLTPRAAPESPAGRTAGARLPQVSLPSGLVAAATWNGKNVSSASSPGAAFSLAKGQTALVDFSYAGDHAANITNATLEVTYLGVVIATSSSSTHVVGGPPVTGAGQINWSFGNLYDALEGVFQLTASLDYANGTSAWSQSFYVFAKAPYLLESGAVIVFLALTIAELYWGVASVRDARRARKGPAPPAAAPPGGGPPSGGGPGPGTAATAGGPEAPPGGPPEPAPPPPPETGGGTGGPS